MEEEKCKWWWSRSTSYNQRKPLFFHFTLERPQWDLSTWHIWLVEWTPPEGACRFLLSLLPHNWDSFCTNIVVQVGHHPTDGFGVDSIAGLTPSCHCMTMQKHSWYSVSNSTNAKCSLGASSFAIFRVRGLVVVPRLISSNVDAFTHWDMASSRSSASCAYHNSSIDFGSGSRSISFSSLADFET